MKRVGFFIGGSLNSGGSSSDITAIENQIEAIIDQLGAVVKKGETGVLDINAFDEATRNILMNQEEGFINAVLGEGNVQTVNIATGAVTPDKVSKGTNSTVQTSQILQHPTDTRSVEIIRINGVATEIREKDGENTVKLTKLTYDGDTITSVSSTADETTVTSTIERDGKEITGIKKGVSKNV